MKFRPYLIAFGLCFLMFIAGFAIWATHDDEPLDYSSMDIEIGPKDASINGYTQLQEIGDSLEFDLDILESRSLNGEYPDPSPFAATTSFLTQAQMQALVDVNADKMAPISNAFSRAQFQIDEMPTPEFQIYGPAEFLRYIKVSCIMARLLVISEEPDQALEIILQLDKEISRLSDSGGGLLHLYICIASAKITNEELTYLLAHSEPSKAALHYALQNYPLRGQLIKNYENSIKWEFQLACSALELIKEKPQEIKRWIDELEYIPGGLLTFAYKPHTTRNLLFGHISKILENAALPYSKRIDIYPQRRPIYQMVLAGNPVGEMSATLLFPAYGGPCERALRGDIESDTVYLMLAMRLYQMDHGVLPLTLEALAPEYIDAVPIDPFDEQPLRYDAQRAIIYSVGEDTVDSGGSGYLSRLDYNHPDYENAVDNQQIAEADDKDEPTFHIRFDLEPRDFSAADEEEQQP
ncbi:hypothetical protein [Cerasicoccus frondis]|uniref:hypothetical protein n=1 Tax=Cerasicoccus frondis TaxID=490090 RepID=UPI002852A0D3|nr:hypothetical protein [Cerasicoccus frondis]